MLKPYDPKKSYWVPDGEGGFLEGSLESEAAGKVGGTVWEMEDGFSYIKELGTMVISAHQVVVTVNHEKKTLKKEQIQQVAL